VLKEIALIIVPFFSVFTCVFVLMFCLTRKKRISFIIGSFAVVTAVSGLLNIFLILNGYFELNDKIKIFQSLLYLPLIILLFKEMLFQRIFTFFMLMTIISFLRLLGIILADLFLPYGENINFLMLIVITFFLYFIYIILVLKFGRKLFKKVFAHGRTKEWILYLLSAAASWFILEILQALYQSNLILTLTFMFFVIWSSMILFFAIINTHERMKQKYEADFSRDIISAGLDHYKKMNEQYETLRIMKHDYKFHLQTAVDILYSGNMDKSREYLSGLQEQFEKTEIAGFCSNIVINSLVADYARKCKELNINFNVSISIPPDFNIPNYEMCIVFGNLLENAIEACQKIENNRQIKLVLKPMGEQLILMVRNTFDGNVIMEGEKYISTKKNGAGRECGIGLESVKAVTDRFGEVFKINHDNEYFNVYVLWKSSNRM